MFITHVSKGVSKVWLSVYNHKMVGMVKIHGRR